MTDENKQELCELQMKHEEMVIVIEHDVEVEGRQPCRKLKRAVNLVNISCKMVAPVVRRHLTEVSEPISEGHMSAQKGRHRHKERCRLHPARHGPYL